MKPISYKQVRGEWSETVCTQKGPTESSLVSNSQNLEMVWMQAEERESKKMLRFSTKNLKEGCNIRN